MCQKNTNYNKTSFINDPLVRYKSYQIHGGDIYEFIL